MKHRQASPSKKWVEYTEEHGRIRQHLQDAICDLKANKERDPIALVGPYRTGKTQFLIQTFFDAWEEGVPALYVSAKQLFDEMGEANEEVSEWLTRRTKSQVENILKGDTADWLLDWDQSAQEKEWLEEIAERDLEPDSNTILLVDEIEQGYKTLRKGDFVDDDNPLRVLLDDTQDVNQVWAFGLVSAYELGEADYARFDEQRIPILSVEDVRDTIVQRTEKSPKLAAGIWWLARGRIGWTNWLIDRAPAQDERIPEWVRDASEFEFEGVTPINSEAWTDSRVSEEDWDAARRTAVFLRDGYDDWCVNPDSDDGLSIEDASILTLSILRELHPSGLSGGANQILETNINRLFRNLTPTDTEAPRDFLPVQILAEVDEADALIDLLLDLVVSFEGDRPERSEAIDYLEQLDPSDFLGEWNSKYYKEVEESIGSEPWCPKLSVLNDAYPPVAVNPSVLNETQEISTEEIRADRSSGIEVASDVDDDAVRYEALYCPNETSLRAELDRAARPRELNKVYVLITSVDTSTYDFNTADRELRDAERIHIVQRDTSRLWDFVLNVDEYLRREHNVEGAIAENDIDTAITTEEQRDKRTTLSMLRGQLFNITENEIREAISDFREIYSRINGSQPIWAERLSGNAGPETNPPAVYGSVSRPLQALAYTLAVSRYDVRNLGKVSDVSGTMYSGTQNDLLKLSSQGFRFTQFVDSTLTKNGLPDSLLQFSRRFVHHGNRDPAVEKFQNLMLILLGASDSDISDFLKLLTDMDASRSDIDLFANSEFEDQLSVTFAWGVLLEELAYRQHEQITGSYKGFSNTLNELGQRIGDLKREIEAKNDELQPPDDLADPVTLDSSITEELDEHIETLEKDIESLSTETADSTNFAGPALVYKVILSSYLSEINRRVSQIENAVFKSTFRNVRQLKLRYNNALEKAEAESGVYDVIDSTELEVKDQIESIGTDLFRFIPEAGGASIDPEDRDTFEDINSVAAKREGELSELVNAIEELIELIQTRRDRQQELQDGFVELSEEVTK